MSTMIVTNIREAVEACSPAIDAVELWLTPTVEQDYVARAALPGLHSGRDGLVVRTASGRALHFLSQTEAALLLADCEQRATEVGGGLLNAYNRHSTRLCEAMAQAKRRAALAGTSSPSREFVCERSERWIGTIAQLRTLGINTYPGDPGAKAKRLQTQDARGYRSWVCASSRLWPGFFEVEIELPKPRLGAGNVALSLRHHHATSARIDLSRLG